MRVPHVVAAFGCLFVAGIVDNSRGPLFPQVLTSLTLSDGQGAWFFAAASATGALGSLAGQVVIARAGIMSLLRLGLVVLAVGAVLIGRSSGLGALVAAAAVLGLGLGALGLVHGALLERAVPPERRRRMFSGLHSMYCASSFLAPVYASACARAGLGWGLSFQLLAFVPLALLVGTVHLGEPPDDHASPPPAPPPPAPPLPARLSVPMPSPPRVEQRDLDHGSRRRAITVAFTAALYVAAELALSTRIVQHLVKDRGATDERASAHLALFFALMLVGRAVGAFVTVPLPNRVYLVASALVSAGLAALGLLVHPAFLCVSALTMAPFFPTLMDLVAQEFPAEFARVTSLLLFVVSAVVMLTHELIGLISDASSLRVALGLAPLYLVVAALLVPASRSRS